MFARAATVSAAFMLGVLLAGTTPSWAGSHSAPGGGLPGEFQGQTDLPWGTTLKKAPTGNTSQSAFSPTNLQIPLKYCSRMPKIPGRLPTECVPSQ